MLKFFKPFEPTTRNQRLTIGLVWLVVLGIIWGIYGTMGETHMFPTPSQVWDGFSELYSEGLMVHVISSLALCGKAVFVGVLLSLAFVYLSPIPIIKPISYMVSKLRYLPLTGLAFYITMMVSSGRSIQVWILVIFMGTFLTTSLLSMVKNIAQEEFDHARALGCSRWEIVWEVIIKGRLDYVLETIRQNLAIIYVMLVTVESIMVASGGLGFLIKNSDKQMNHGRIVALQLVILLIGLGLDFALTKLRKFSFRYSKY
jgi:NitT/TauT family transport system permease protein